jgi:hypothetical protein
VVRGVLEGEAAELLQRFFRQLREQNAEIRADLTSASSVEPQKGKGFT